MSSKKTPKENEAPVFQEPSAKRRKTSGPPLKSTQNTPTSVAKFEKITPKPTPEPPKFATEPTIDELIYPDATFKSYEEFEEKFNAWKAKHFHPFRVASSESLRTEDGTVSEKFKYRYVVFHCARYGMPRMRGGGKRPNQNYLPCSCTAMVRLNFNYNEQCLKLTSLETRHSNHTVSQDLFEKMCIKDKARRSTLTPKRKDQTERVVNVKKEPSEDRADSETTRSSRQSTLEPPVSINYDAPLNVPQTIAPSVPVEIPEVAVPDPYTFPLQQPNIQLLQYQQNLQNQIMLNQIQMQALSSSTYQPYTPPSDWSPTSSSTSSSMAPPAPSNPQTTSAQFPLAPPPPDPQQQISPALSSVDEMDGGVKTFHSLETVRPIPLRPSENSAFTRMIREHVSPIPRAEIELVLGSAHKMLVDSHVAPEVTRHRIQQLNQMLIGWTQL